MSSPAMRVASAPVSFGVDEIMIDDAWMPGPRRHARLDGRHRVRGDRARARPATSATRGQVHERLTVARASSSSARSCPSTSAGPRRPTRTGPGCATACAWSGTGSPAGSQAVRDPVRPVRRARPAGVLRADRRSTPRRGCRRPASTRSSTTSTGPPSCAAPRASSRSSTRTPGRTSRPPTRSPGSWTGSTRRSSACASTPARPRRLKGPVPAKPRPQPPRPRRLGLRGPTPWAATKAAAGSPRGCRHAAKAKPPPRRAGAGGSPGAPAMRAPQRQAPSARACWRWRGS